MKLKDVLEILIWMDAWKVLLFAWCCDYEIEINLKEKEK